MIPGLGGTKRSWGKIASQLSKFGEVYSYTPIFYSKYKKGLTEKDLILSNHCEQLFENIHLKKNQKIIIISHSIGSYFAYQFAKKIQNAGHIINHDGPSFYRSCWKRTAF